MKLYVVATPIGHLDDFSYRAIHTLQQVDLIAAEDTRHSRLVLTKYNIETAMISLHAHNESTQTDQLLQRLLAGEGIALLSDAGTPLINDPGYLLVKRAHEAGIPVSPIPGPCAAIAALSAAGLPADTFQYIGFLPTKTTERENYLETLCHRPHTLIFYEAPHRILACVESLCKVFGQTRPACLAKELTKLHEKVYTADLSAIREWLLADKARQKGEFVLLTRGYLQPKDETLTEEQQRILHILLEELPTKQAVKLAAKITGMSRNRLYEWAIR